MAADLAAIADALRRRGLLRAAPERLPPLHGVATDTRQLRPGMLFCAVRGVSDDGHRYLAGALAAGAAAALVEEPHDLPLPQLVVADGRRAAAVAAALWYGRPGDRLRLLGVTGTNGKGSTVAILRHLWAAVEPTAALGTVGAQAPDGRPVPSDAGTLTTPGPVGLQQTLADLLALGARAVALEVSSHALTQARVAELGFAAAVFTNLTPEHLDYHRDMDDYFRAKARFLEHLTPDGLVVVNADDPAWHRLPAQERRISYAIHARADVRAESLALGPTGSEFVLVAEGERAAVRLPLLGSFNVANALAAAACAVGLGRCASEVAVRLESAPQIPGRMEQLATEPCLVIRDYAHTADALERVLETIRPLALGRVILVMGAGGDRDRTKRGPMGAVAARLADVRIVTTDNPRTEDPVQTMRDLEAGMGDARRERIADRAEAIAAAVALARAGDVILLAGKGHETYQIVGREKLPFDERAIVRRLVARQG